MSSEVEEEKKLKKGSREFSHLHESNTQKIICKSQKIRDDVRNVLERPPTAKLLDRESNEPKV